MSVVHPSSPDVSVRMSRQTNRDTGIELAVRRLLHASGYRYRIHYPVPGMRRRKIDIAFTGARLAVLIDGCFWHGCPEHATSPKANAEWWRRKLDRNIERDKETNAQLLAEGWTFLRFWEHESPDAVMHQVAAAVDREKACGRKRRQ
ncbi:very short patch repair endonuclease [Streptomyces griseiscabiei]|uniref:Very short patch repair endonuclease n=1 Tax=Streptomyces griseiscabiei TaxID=2993540 RepID=A0ABU4KZN1_9ACTN|nr:very short patch repair endonuclease [Streptomyces griseiscabiei]MBZ3901035.1 very short patch repair endonuclease [Streptomyces griseiscabiei]MDX2908834.1 very short patch repair endonuclease [Streptomyces griseiscabiei]